MKEEETPYLPEPCRYCKDPIYDDHREFEYNGYPACLKCYLKGMKKQLKLMPWALEK